MMRGAVSSSTDLEDSIPHGIEGNHRDRMQVEVELAHEVGSVSFRYSNAQTC